MTVLSANYCEFTHPVMTVICLTANYITAKLNDLYYCEFKLNNFILLRMYYGEFTYPVMTVKYIYCGWVERCA
jgi:hypothetical protein